MFPHRSLYRGIRYVEVCSFPSYEMRIFGIVYLTATRSTVTVVKLNLEKPFVEIKWLSPALEERTSGGKSGK